MKKILSLILTVILTATLAACGGNGDSTDSSSGGGSQVSSEAASNNGFELTRGTEYTEFQNGNNVVVCFGDSITRGWDSPSGYVYPDQLESDLKGQYKVYNAGVYGETAATISSRANSIDFCLSGDVVFAAGVSRVDLDRELFMTAAGEKITYLEFGYDLPHDTVIINGQKYTIEYAKTDKYQHGIYTLVRGNADKALTLKKGTAVQYDYSGELDSVYCAIVLMGANDGDSGSDELIAKYRKFAEKYPRHILIMPFYYTDQNAKFEAEFGKNALNIRDYLVNHAAEDYNQELSDLDEYCVRKNTVPTVFLYNQKRGDVHLSSLGYKVLADQVYKRGVELGYWK